VLLDGQTADFPPFPTIAILKIRARAVADIGETVPSEPFSPERRAA